MNQTQTTLGGEDSVDGRVLHVAFELSESKWVLAFSDGRAPAAKARIVSIAGRDLKHLSGELAKAKRRFELPARCGVVSCYEAGRDGFWLHRHLQSIGVQNLIVDSASIAVSRRKRRAKTDRLDARKLLAMLLRHQRGEREVWSVVRVPSVEDEDARQLHRELQQLKKEVLQHRLRINSLLVAQGLKLPIGQDFLPQLGLARLHDGRPVPADLQARLHREYQRLGCGRHSCDRSSERVGSWCGRAARSGSTRYDGCSRCAASASTAPGCWSWSSSGGASSTAARRSAARAD